VLEDRAWGAAWADMLPSGTNGGKQCLPWRLVRQIRKGRLMHDSDRLRDRATQLLALARKARDDGKVVADELTRLATEASDHADELDRREVQHQQSAHQRVFPGAALGSAQRTSSRGQAARSAGACTYRAPIR